MAYGSKAFNFVILLVDKAGLCCHCWLQVQLIKAVYKFETPGLMYPLKPKTP